MVSIEQTRQRHVVAVKSRPARIITNEDEAIGEEAESPVASAAPHARFLA
jgi:hypothetical protein